MVGNTSVEAGGGVKFDILHVPTGVYSFITNRVTNYRVYEKTGQYRAKNLGSKLCY